MEFILYSSDDEGMEENPARRFKLRSVIESGGSVPDEKEPFTHRLPPDLGLNSVTKGYRPAESPSYKSPPTIHDSGADILHTNMQKLEGLAKAENQYKFIKHLERADLDSTTLRTMEELATNPIGMVAKNVEVLKTSLDHIRGSWEDNLQKSEEGPPHSQHCNHQMLPTLDSPNLIQTTSIDYSIGYSSSRLGYREFIKDI